MAGYYENYLRTYKDYITVTAAAVAGVNGTAVGTLQQVPQGFLFKLLRYSVFSNSAGAPVFELFVASQNEWLSPNWLPDRSRRLDYTASGKNNISDSNSPPVFDEGETALFFWSGGTNGDICQATVMVAVYEKAPQLSLRDMRGLHEQTTNEDEQRKEAVVVGGSGWNAGVYLPDDMESNGYDPWASRDPGDAADNPAQWAIAAGMGQYVGGNAESTQHPKPPYDGRILPDGSTDSTS